MKRPSKDPLLRLVESYFDDHLRRVRGASRHTLRAYAHALRLFFIFLADRRRRAIADLRVDDVQADAVLAFVTPVRGSSHGATVRCCATHTGPMFVESPLRRLTSASSIGAFLAVADCHATAYKGEEPMAATVLTITSQSFGPNEPIPIRHTCEGQDISPGLSWSGAPSGTKSLALIVDDPDAPDPKAPKMTWVHWVVYNIPASVTELAEGAATGLPGGAFSGKNDWKRAGYGGPCPPIGRHRYFHKVYALDVVLPDLRGPDKASLLNAMHGHVLGDGQLVGTYQKAK